MRKKRNYQRKFVPDFKHNNIAVTRFMNYLMEGGKKSAAEKIVYGAFKIMGEKIKVEPLVIFEKALENAAPTIEVRSRRVGGANYQIPQEVRPARKFMLATRWIIGASRSKKGKSMAEKLAEELMAAYNNEGAAIKKKQDVHRMAEANRAFAHFAR
ncbi:MAG: 30S ribosomal protein S7 [Candidatus Colwellbacteria bacterium RIFCSPHIGHO2_12_FULL_43_12]|uniref:Small ribosomal subunit protein uS7 n=3 Tax=Candidatus Colwelliibacteriota TaxID=1817904 RepID=A0A1G1YZY5_9BACT|nr:MAG: 30S ribosomal protein S7 [Candidatus Colwellbacteria bacterium RIFCSPHIGHO2_02_FULL_43_15]OGY58329.1 MAG: 30S ribosomal protein S7 [Candidatus Colwellbacteria bacterium RIFCSPHIGHO2_12_FULL_43_12]OGY60701.1 MAG: 30S ribosomal protein S7 [Candidatus Colwellbacteria bacterium RIFCSPLOWO2_12_FULL_43_11]